MDVKSEHHEVLNFALDMGKTLLLNGAEIFRVEETITHVCNHFGVKEVDLFVMSNGIIMTAGEGHSDFFAKVKHVPLSSVRLSIVVECNDLSREIVAGHTTLAEGKERLEQIKNMPPPRAIVRILAAGLGSAGFAYLMGANAYEAIATIFIACMLYVFVIFAVRHKLSKMLINIIGGVIITTLAILICSMHLPIRFSMDKMIMGSILPLVPGLAVVNSIRDIANGDFISGTVRVLDALLVFVYIAIGVGIIISLSGRLMGGVWF